MPAIPAHATRDGASARDLRRPSLRHSDTVYAAMSTNALRPLDWALGPVDPTGGDPVGEPFDDARDGDAYRVLLACGDRSLLSRLSAFIEELGYEVDQAADAAMAVCAAGAARHDFLIADENLANSGKGELLRSLERISQQPFYSLWLGDIRDGSAVTAALVAGFDDFLAKPISHGELLSRLRAGARRLQFERRWRWQAARDSLTGLPTRLAFAARVAREQERPAGSRAPTACALVEIDYLDRIAANRGAGAAVALQVAFAKTLHGLAPSPADWFWADGHFAALLWDHSPSEAVHWCERFAKAVAANEFRLESAAEKEPSTGESLRLTVSQGVAELEPADHNGEVLLRHARAALRQARRQGRGVVARFDAGLARQSSNPSDSAVAAGQRFVQAPARDFMTPCTVMLRKTDAASSAVRLLRQGAHEVLPVVDGRGKLIGIVSEGMMEKESGSGADFTGKEVADLMLEKPVHRDEETTFPDLLNFFTQSTDAWLVITRAGRPTGLIGRDTLASLTAPLCREDYRCQRPANLSGEYLFAT